MRNDGMILINSLHMQDAIGHECGYSAGADRRLATNTLICCLARMIGRRKRISNQSKEYGSLPCAFSGTPTTAWFIGARVRCLQIG